MERYTDYLEARKAAILKADRSNFDVAIRKVKEYGKIGYNLSFAAKMDSDYYLTEIIKPGTLF